ncbi:MAG: YdeI/OmpD-associated family protein [Chloroflexota bacterium]
MPETLPPGPDGRERILFETRAEWRAWLAANEDRTQGIWLVTWKRGTGRPSLSYDDLVEEALCAGWIDSTAGRVDETRSMLWVSPRRKGSAWSRPNKERVARLEAAGLLREPGIRAIERSKADGTWSRLDQVEEGVIPDDLEAAFDAVPGSREAFTGFSRSVRRMFLEWIAQARRPETRAARVRETAERAARGEKVPGPARTPEG